MQCGALEWLHQQRKRLKDLKKQLWIVLHFSQLTDEMIHASSLSLSMVALHNTPCYSREIDYIGFLGKKKDSQRGLRSILSCRLYFGLLHKISNVILLSMICDPIRDPIRDPIGDLICDPVCDPICKLKSF